MDTPSQIPTTGTDINFSQSSHVSWSADRVRRIDRTISIVTAIGMVVFVILFIGLIIFRTIVVSQSTAVDQRIQDTTQQLQSLSPVETAYLIFVKKVQLLTGIQQDRKLRKDALDFLYALIPSEDVLKQVDLNQKEKKIIFSVATPDVFALSTLLKKIFSTDTSSGVFQVKTEGLTRSADGTYALDASLSFDRGTVDGVKK